MATETQSVRTGGLTWSLMRSFLTQYWPFTAYVMGYITVGMALGSVTGAWSWENAAILLVAMWFGLEGLHAIDLSASDIATRVDSVVQRVSGVVGLVIGAAVGVFIASRVGWVFLIFVGVEVFLGLAYNLELFGGLLHDFGTPSGLLNFGVSWGAIPFLAGWFVMAGGVSVGALVISLGICLDAMQLIAMFEVSKPAPYNDLGIHHDRDIDQDVTLMNKVAHRGNKMAMASWVLLAVGMVITFVL